MWRCLTVREGVAVYLLAYRLRVLKETKELVLERTLDPWSLEGIDLMFTAKNIIGRFTISYYIMSCKLESPAKSLVLTYHAGRYRRGLAIYLFIYPCYNNYHEPTALDALCLLMPPDL